jgi:hypothetical protein
LFQKDYKSKNTNKSAFVGKQYVIDKKYIPGVRAFISSTYLERYKFEILDLNYHNTGDSEISLEKNR